MDAIGWIVLAVAVFVTVGVIVWAIVRARRTNTLRERFGPEYDHEVVELGGRREAERELSDRVERDDELQIRPLSKDLAVRYRGRWRNVQARFVDDPVRACADADAMITNVMRDRGYPVDDFEQRSADVSVDHADVVSDYRAAHGVALANQRGQATTEDLRQAMIHYRALFDGLVASEGAMSSQESAR